VQALARVCGVDRAMQARVLLAHLGLLLVMWRVHDSLTHTVLSACLALWGSVALIKALSQPRYWPLVGVLAALACLSKLNGALWCVSSLLAAWFVILRGDGQAQQCRGEAVRSHLLWMLAALGVFLLVMAPYAQWWVSRPSDSVALARRIVVSDADLPVWQPVVEVLLGALEYVMLAPLLLVALAWRFRRQAAPQPTPAGRWLYWQTIIGLLVLVLSLTAMKGSHFTPRWLWPVVPGVTVGMCLWALQITDALPSPRWRQMADMGLWAMPILALVLAAFRVWEPTLNAQRCQNCWTDRPAVALSTGLHTLHGAAPLRVIAADGHLAGILASVGAGDLTRTSVSSDLPAPDGFAGMQARCVAAWISMDRPVATPAANLQELMGSAPLSEVRSISWPMRLAPQRQIWLQSIALPPEACARAAP
jgi:hypothetical protein